MDKRILVALLLSPSLAFASGFFSFPNIDDALSDIKAFGMGILFILCVISFHEVIAKFLRFRLFRKRRW